LQYINLYNYKQYGTHLSHLFLLNDATIYNLRRGRSSVLIPKPKTNNKKRSISYRGAIEWNKLNSNIQLLLSIFMNRLKRKSI
jgi:hypothetical protein